MLFCHKRRKSYKFTEDVARDWDYYIPGVEWTPSHVCTVTENKRNTAANVGKVKSQTTEINYKVDPDEYRFSLPSDENCTLSSELTSESSFTGEVSPSVNNIKNKYGDYTIRINGDESLVTIQSPEQSKVKNTPPGASVWNSGLWKAATWRMRKILRQFIDFVGTSDNNKELAVVRAARAAMYDDDNDSESLEKIMSTSSKDLMVENEAFTDSGYLEDYEFAPGKRIGSNKMCHFNKPSDGRSTLCSRCMREYKSTSSESSLQAIGESIPTFKGKRSGSTKSQIKSWHRENKYKTRRLSKHLNDKIDNMPITDTKDYTTEVDSPLMDTFLKGTISDIGMLFPSTDGSDKYCFDHLEPVISEPSLFQNDNMTKKALLAEAEDDDTESLNEQFSISTLVSPYSNKHLYRLTFENSEEGKIDSQSIMNENMNQNNNESQMETEIISDSSNQIDVDELIWEEMENVS